MQNVILYNRLLVLFPLRKAGMEIGNVEICNPKPYTLPICGSKSKKTH